MSQNLENSKVSNVKKFKSTLPRARLKMLNIDNRYLKDAEEMRRASVSESRRRGAATLKRRRLAAAERQQE
jgi:hypothetical protein